MKKHILSYEEISQLCLELSLFLHAGADIGGGISLLANEIDTPWLKDKLCAMAKGIDNGKTLSAVFEESALFPRDAVSMLAVGERTGRTEEALKSLAKYYESRQIQDNKIKSAIVYPSVLLLVMTAVIVTLLTKVLPIFSEVYASHGGSMTGFTGALLRFGEFLNAALPLLAIVMILAIMFLIPFSFSQRLREKIFFGGNRKFKGITKALGMARFARALSMGLSSGLTSEEAVKNAAMLLCDIPKAKERAENCLAAISNGEKLADAISDAALMPKSECRLLAIGVAGGSGEDVAEKIAERLERHAEEETERKLNVIEPMIVTLTSVLVGLILLAVMLPLTNIMSSIG